MGTCIFQDPLRRPQSTTEKHTHQKQGQTLPQNKRIENNSQRQEKAKRKAERGVDTDIETKRDRDSERGRDKQRQ